MRISLVIALMLFATDLAAQTTQPTTQPADTLDELAAKQAPLEAQIGLRLYEEGEDYRAITALQRYRILAGTPEAAFLAHLLTGQIYHRNARPDDAVVAFERATLSAKNDHDRTFAFLLATQEECVALSLYFRCAERLGAVADSAMSEEVRDLVDYQRLYVDLVLRQPDITVARAKLLRDPVLRQRGLQLVERDVAFDALPLKSPFLSGLLSAVVPGAGQLYNNKPVDALLSFVFVGGFGAATYFSITELESIPLGIVSGLLALGFYTGNIINAVSDSKRINAQTYLDFFERLKTDHWARVRFSVSDDRVTFGYSFDWDAKGN